MTCLLDCRRCMSHSYYAYRKLSLSSGMMTQIIRSLVSQKDLKLLYKWKCVEKCDAQNAN